MGSSADYIRTCAFAPCGTIFVRDLRTGRPNVTCSLKCAQRRRQRLRNDARNKWRAEQRASAHADAVLLVAAAEDVRGHLKDRAAKAHAS